MNKPKKFFPKIRKFWVINPVGGPHSTKKGDKGYCRRKTKSEMRHLDETA